ncbi:redoxin domain-containing protein [Haloferacaceae archaeon DSL9]
MLAEGDVVPDFTAPMATPETASRAKRGSYTGDDVEPFSLDAALESGPVVFATFPGVYSRTCTRELCELRDWIADFEDLPGAVYGLSADTPWSALAFIDEYDISYPIVSGFNTSVLDDFGVAVPDGLLRGIATRAVFVIAPDREVTYTWRAEEPLVFPDLDELEAALTATTSRRS